MKKYRITVKEVGHVGPIDTTYSGDKDEKGLIEFFGLENEDVEWYKKEELPWEEQE